MALHHRNLTEPSLLLLLLLLLLRSSALAAAFSASSLFPAAHKQREFDYFLLALQWPGTVCRSTTTCCSSNGCCDRSVPLSEFTIHGLWADYDDGSWPSCCSQENFDINQILPLLGELREYWPSFSCSSTSLCYGGKGLFWAHEWEKHGTCMSPIIKDEYSYFSTTLNLYFKHNITKILDDAGFVASDDKEYQIGNVVSAIKNAVGALPLLVCSNGAVEELRLCFYKDFKPRDCVLGNNNFYHDLDYSSGSCPEYISLPNYKRISEGGKSTTTWLADDKAFPMITESSI